MTICVAAIGDNGLIIGAADRMKTGGDIEFEPRKTTGADFFWGGGSKILPITISISALTAGDSSLQAEILHHVFCDANEQIKADPNEWLRVEEIANLYVRHYDRIKRRRAVSAILAPLDLDSEKFLEAQSTMSPDLVGSITRHLQSYAMPKVKTIFVGVDKEASHIFVSSNCNDENSCVVTCSDTTGFAAIGSGARHALSQFMLVGYHRRVPTSETLFQTYLAKKRAEIAPGVGKETDLFTIGPQLGFSGYVKPEVLEGIHKIYQRYHKSELALMKRASKEAEEFQKGLLDQDRKAQGGGETGANPQT